ncbi:hypothetical protein TEA_000848 [Camellia sinensis var. sinensis]|uniref:Uncharacterized protein n=2 Tax=Camellia sinensis TaxID=4442 RepID=A0A4S4DKG0_CAMSN|nr:hypothetical protein TEA_000848 [Camellia sinensis var. sinensis]
MYMAYGWPEVIPLESGPCPSSKRIIYLKLTDRLLLVVAPSHLELWSSSQVKLSNKLSHGQFLCIHEMTVQAFKCVLRAVVAATLVLMLGEPENGPIKSILDNIIVILPWDEWILSQDDSSSHIALLPLHPDLRAKFNETAAWEYALSMAGKPYGFHNLIFSWIDTIDGNYPPPLDAHLVASVMTVWNQLQPAYAANIWNEALNKRLGTQTKQLDPNEQVIECPLQNSQALIWMKSHTITDIIMHLIFKLNEMLRGTSFDELLTIPEQDNWVYSDGLSTSCIAFVLEMYKEAGIFGPLASSIQVTEFTIKEAYTLKFFENNSSRLPKWCNNDGDPVKLPFCQIKEKYRMELPEYNTMELYSHMNETCPSLPPKYYRPRVVESLLICFSCLGVCYTNVWCCTQLFYH